MEFLVGTATICMDGVVITSSLLYLVNFPITMCIILNNVMANSHEPSVFFALHCNPRQDVIAGLVIVSWHGLPPFL
jgi:hypothetical protein